jgi:hypothetical protein
LYRIITITRLVRTTDISWAKSDVFIWSTVEPSVGIISGCLPALRPLLMRIMSTCGYTPSEHTASHSKGKESAEESALETISKKRTRKPGEVMGDTQFLESIDEEMGEGGDGEDGNGDGDGEMQDVELGDAPGDENHSRHWRLDDHNVSRTTMVQGQSGEGTADDGGAVPSRKSNSIRMTREFEWDEESINRAAGSK